MLVKLENGDKYNQIELIYQQDGKTYLKPYNGEAIEINSNITTIQDLHYL